MRFAPFTLLLIAPLDSSTAAPYFAPWPAGS